MLIFFKPMQVPSNDDPTLADKEAILASLNIKAMTFDDTIGVLNKSKLECGDPQQGICWITQICPNTNHQQSMLCMQKENYMYFYKCMLLITKNLNHEL